MAVPSFLLKKLYVKGSLKNTASGFELALKNSLAPGSLIGLGPLKVDDREYPPSAVSMETPQGEFMGDQISSKNPLTFAMGNEVKIRVQGEPITEGTHRIAFSVLTREVGRIEFDLTDDLTP